MKGMRPKTLGVIGLGAIGGSVAWQARQAGVPRVIGFSPEPGEAVQALKAGAISDMADSAERAMRAADLVVLATPPAATIGLLARVAPHLSGTAFVTDTASVKAPVLAAAARAGLGSRYAGSHPFAGTHESGWNAARPDRFRGAVVYVCAGEQPEAERTAREVMNFWSEVCGAHPVLIDPVAHDRQLAWTSHLPQAVATALAATLSRQSLLAGASVASGFRDTTRLALSPSELWTQLFSMNRDAVLEALAALEHELAELKRLIAAPDAAELQRYLEAARAFRARVQ